MIYCKKNILLLVRFRYIEIVLQSCRCGRVENYAFRKYSKQKGQIEGTY